MPKNQPYYGMPKMQGERSATYDDVPVVARSRSFQQPVSEAVEQTEYALKQRYNYGKMRK